MSNIIINDLSPYNQYLATAAQTVFQYVFPIFNEEDISVYLTPDGQVPDDATQILILNIDYTVQDVGVETGGTITLVNPAALNDQITIIRSMPYNRTTNYENYTEFDVEEFNKDFQRIILMVQQNRMIVDKFITRYQNTILFEQKNLKLPTLGDGQIWRGNTSGIVAAELNVDPGASTLRSELANDQPGTDGSRLVGYHDAVLGSTTVHDALIATQVGLYGVDTGTANTYVVTLSPAPSSLTTIAGKPIQVRIANANTGASTFNPNGLGPKAVRMAYKGTIVDPPANSVITGMMAQFVYDPVADIFFLMNPDRLTDFLTGTVLLNYRPNALTPAGWVKLNDGTIGSAASGATERANADTEALYTLLWDGISFPSGNTWCPVIGGLGASALADFAANKPLGLPLANGKVFGKFGLSLGDPYGFAPGFGEPRGISQTVLTEAQMPIHSHEYTQQEFIDWKLEDGSAYRRYGPKDVQTGQAGGGLAHTNIQPCAFCNAMIKL